MLGCHKCLLLYRINPCLINNLQYYHWLYCHVCLVFSSLSPIVSRHCWNWCASHLFWSRIHIFSPSMWSDSFIKAGEKSTNYIVIKCYFGTFHQLFYPYQWRLWLKRDLVSRFYCLQKKEGVFCEWRDFNEAESLNLGFKREIEEEKGLEKKKKKNSFSLISSMTLACPPPL